VTKHEDDNDEKQIVITLALIQQALTNLTERVEDHHKVLFGNGSPENSVVWALKMLAQSIDKLEKQLATSQKQSETIQSNENIIIQAIQNEINNLRDNDANLSWKQWFKKITIKWLPILVILLIFIIPFHEPLGQLLCALIKLIN